MTLAIRTHFHIRWNGTSALDYDAFDSTEKADEAAKAWVRHNETYSIEQFDESCKRCRGLLAKTLRQSRRKPSPRK